MSKESRRRYQERTRTDCPTPAEAARRLLDLRVDALTVVKTGIITVVNDQGFELDQPYVYADMSNRPDVFDLPRIHRTEGQGDATTCWDIGVIRGIAAIACVSIDLTRPVKCTFRVIFDLFKDAPILYRIAARGGFVLTGVAPEEGADAVGGNGIYWDCYSPELRQTMAVLASVQGNRRNPH